MHSAERRDYAPEHPWADGNESCAFCGGHAPTVEHVQIGTFAFAFVCHHQTFLAYRSLRRASRRRFAIVSHVATLGALILSLTLGIAGYVTFWESTSSDIFNSYIGACVGQCRAVHFVLPLVLVNNIMISRIRCEGIAMRH